jgi:hypothetical protein
MPLRGLEEFLPRKNGGAPAKKDSKEETAQYPVAGKLWLVLSLSRLGRSWKASELRTKASSDLEKLWWILLKERNALMTEKDAARSQRGVLQNGMRLSKVQSFRASLTSSR